LGKNDEKNQQIHDVPREVDKSSNDVNYDEYYIEMLIYSHFTKKNRRECRRNRLILFFFVESFHEKEVIQNDIKSTV
jgi:hypothetical protein